MAEVEYAYGQTSGNRWLCEQVREASWTTHPAFAYRKTAQKVDEKVKIVKHNRWLSIESVEMEAQAMVRRIHFVGFGVVLVLAFATSSVLAGGVSEKIKQAEKLQKSMEYDRAEQIYEEIIADHAGMEHGLGGQMGIAISYVRLGDEAGASAAIRKLQAEYSGEPNFASAVFQVGEAYYYEACSHKRYGRQAAAEACFRSAITLWETIINGMPQSDATRWAYFFSANCYRELGQDKKAIAYYQQVVNKWPHALRWSPGALRRIISLYERLERSGAASTSETAINIRQAAEKFLTDYPTATGVKDIRRILEHWNFVDAWLVSTGAGVKSQDPSDPDEAEIESAQERMQSLRLEYEELYESAAHFVQVVDEAKGKEPRLAALEAGLRRLRDIEQRQGIGKFLEYRNMSKDPDKVKNMFDKCRNVFGAKVLAEALADPNQARELRPALVLLYRAYWTGPPMQDRLTRDLEYYGLAVFDPNDPNEERLWVNIKRYETTRSNSLEPVRRKLLEELEEEGIAKWLAELSGKYDFMQPVFEWSSAGLRFYTPGEVYQALKQFEEAKDRMDDIYPRWFKMRHILTSNAEHEPIIDVAYGYEDIWFTTVTSTRKSN